MTTGKRTLLLPNLRRLFSWRVIRFLVAVAILTVLFYAEEDWRGKLAWEKFQREWEAKGEHFDREAFIPPPIPDDQNFASIPLLAAMFDYQYDPAKKADWMWLTNTAKWRDYAAYQRTQQLSIYRIDANRPSLGQWQADEVCDLKAWQTYYRSMTNFPVAATPQDAAHDMLFALSKFDGVLSEIRAASVRTSARFPVHYDEGMAAMMPHLNMLRNLSRVLALRAVAELNVGSNDQAFADINLCFRLTETIKSEPMLISQLVRMTMVNIILQPVWEGLANHRWTDEQLGSFQEQLMAVNFLEDNMRCMRFARADMNSTITELRRGTLSAHHFLLRYMVIDTLGSMEDAIKLPLPGERLLEFYLRLCPSGWFYLDQVRADRYCQQSIFPLVDVQEQRVFPSQAQRVEEAQGDAFGKHNPHRRLIGLIECGLSGTMVYKFACGQTAINEALVACALERYRLVHKQYPPTMEALAPQFITRVPHDIVNGQPLSYQLTPDGRFVLSSVGWDDPRFGSPLKNSARPWDAMGNWAWRYPMPNPPSN
jgi:hypothetical protein